MGGTGVGWAATLLGLYFAASLATAGLAWGGRQARSRGYELFYALGGVILAQMVVASFRLAVAKGTGGGAIPYLYIVARQGNLAVFLGLLMAISTGYCVTRRGLGGNGKVVTCAPAAFFFATSTIEIILKASYGADETTVVVTGIEGLAFAFSVFVRIFTMVYIAVFVIVSARDSRERLQKVWATRERERRDRARDLRTSTDNDIDIVVEEELDRPMDGEYLHEAGPERTKDKLLQRFNTATNAYASALIVSVLLPVFEPGVASAMARAQDVLTAVFLFALAAIFRPQDSSPYLLLATEGEELSAFGSADTARGGLAARDGDGQSLMSRRAQPRIPRRTDLDERERQPEATLSAPPQDGDVASVGLDATGTS